MPVEGETFKASFLSILGSVDIGVQVGSNIDGSLPVAAITVGR